MDYLDPLELCPNDPKKGEQIRVAVHALMLNPSFIPSRFTLLQFAFGDDVFNFQGGKVGAYQVKPVYEDQRISNREIFELANQAAIAFCGYKIAKSIHTYDRYKYSLKSFIIHMYNYAKLTVEGYAKDANKALQGSSQEDCDIPDESIKEFIAPPVSDEKDTLNYHIVSQWSEVTTSKLSHYLNVYELPVKVVRTKKVGGETRIVTSRDGTRREEKTGYVEEQMLYLELDMSLEECKRAVDALRAKPTAFYIDAASKQNERMSAAEFERFKQHYLENSAKKTFNQVVNNEVNMEIGRLYLLEKLSLTEILDTLGADYPERVAEKLEGHAGAKKPAPLSRGKVRGRIYQNIKPMLDTFMSESESCISE